MNINTFINIFRHDQQNALSGPRLRTSAEPRTRPLDFAILPLPPRPWMHSNGGSDSRWSSQSWTVRLLIFGLIIRVFEGEVWIGDWSELTSDPTHLSVGEVSHWFHCSCHVMIGTSMNESSWNPSHSSKLLSKFVRDLFRCGELRVNFYCNNYMQAKERGKKQVLAPMYNALLINNLNQRRVDERNSIAMRTLRGGTNWSRK